jgi:hypothetical protein
VFFFFKKKGHHLPTSLEKDGLIILNCWNNAMNGLHCQLYIL